MCAMNQIGNAINPNEVLETITRTVRELTSGLEAGKLTKKEKAHVLNELEKLEIKAHKCKLKVELGELKQLHPTLEIRDVLLKTLPSLHSGISSSVLSTLVEYITELWQDLAKEVSA